MVDTRDDRETVSLEGLLMVNMIQVDAVTQLLIEKGIISDQEFLSNLAGA